LTICRENGDEIHLLERLYRELKWHGLVANSNNLSNILHKDEEILGNPDKILWETAEEVGALNSIRTQLEREVDERMSVVYNYDYIMTEKE
jgi:hypothetical protein